MTTDTENTTDETLDTAAMLAEVTDGLFGQDSSPEPEDDVSTEVEGGDKPTEPAPEADLSPQNPDVNDENSQEVKDVGAPDTWTKEELATWATIPEAAKAAILRRESDMHKGLNAYKARAEIGDRFTEVFKPFEGVLESQNIDPTQMVQGFLSNHFNLLAGKPEVKTAIISNLIDFYKIDIQGVLSHMQMQADKPEHVKAMEARIAELESGLSSRERAEYEAKYAEASAAVEAFKAARDETGNLLYPHYETVAGDIAKLIQSGVVPAGPSHLAEAYERAVYMNPTLRQQEIERQASARIEAAKTAEAERVAQARSATAANVRTTQKDRDGAVPKGSWEDTLTETAAAIAARS